MSFRPVRRRDFWVLFFYTLFCLGVSSARAEKYALLIGINDYIFYGPQSDPEKKLPPYDLNRCVNDVLRTSAFLQEAGFKKENIVVLLDQKATRAAMIEAWKSLAAKVQPNDVFYFHFSGHGFQAVALKDKAFVEEDGMDEYIACADFNNNPFAAQDGKMVKEQSGCIRDYDIGLLIAEVKAKKKVFVFDCCHSGTIDRDPNKMLKSSETYFKAREIPFREIKTPPPGLAVAARSRGLGERSGGLGARLRRMGRGGGANSRDLGGAEPDYVLFSGCKDNQTSADTSFNDGGETKAFGAMTFHLTSQYKQNPQDAPANQLLDATRKAMASRFQQEPQLTLSGLYSQNPSAATLQNLLSDRDAGQPAPLVQVTAPAPPEEERTTLRLIGFGAQEAALQQTMARFAYVRLVGANDPAERLLVFRDNRATLRSADDVELADVSAPDMAVVAEKAVPALVQNYLLKKLLLLQNPKSQFRIDLQMRTRNLQVGPATTAQASDPNMPTLKIGDYVEFSVQVDKPAYLTLLDIGTDGKINVLLPNKFVTQAQKAEPGKPYLFPDPNMIVNGERLSVQVYPPAGREMVLAIATAQPLDWTKFESTLIPNLGIRAIGDSFKFGKNAKNLVLQANGTGDDKAWGTAFLLANVVKKE